MNATYNKINCPSDGDLREAVLPHTKEFETGNDLLEHVGTCTDCQARMETLATEGDKRLSSRLKNIQSLTPPKDSAYWNALGKAEQAITVAYGSSDADLTKGISLNFLQSSKDPESLGRLRQFEIRRVIGVGGMGIVLQAFDTVLQRDVAVKVLDPNLMGNTNSKQRFSREARAAAAVTHENIVAVHQVADDELSGLPFFVMQLVVGESLETKLMRLGRLPLAEALRYALHIANGLTAAHAGGLVHRDIKPGNILIENQGDKALLTDFGLARGFEDVKLTRTGFVAGTPLYMAPEQARGDAIDNRVDLYGLGAIMYECLSGRPPFDGTTPLQVLRRITDDEHKPLRKLNPEVPEWLEKIVDKLLEKDPNKRYQSAAEVAAVLTEHAPCVDANSKEVHAAECGPVKTLSRVMGHRKRGKVAAILYLGAAFAIGGLVGSLASVYLLPSTEKIVEIEKPVAVNAIGANPAGVALTPDLGPVPTYTLKGNAGGVWGLAVHPEGKLVATGAEDGVIRIWDQAKEKIVDSFPAHKAAIWSLAYSPDGKKLLSASDDGAVYLWDAVTHERLRSLDHVSSVRSAVLHQDGNLVVTGDRQGTVNLWNLSSKDGPIEFKHGSAINTVAFSPDGLTIASAGSDGKVVIWELTPAINRMRYTFKGHDGPVYSLAFSPDGAWVASAGWDGKLIIWDVNSNRKIKEGKLSSEAIWSVAFTPCQGYLATGSQDGMVKVWMVGDEKEPMKEVQHFMYHKGPVHSLIFSTAAGTLSAGGRDGAVQIWKMNLPKCPPAK